MENEHKGSRELVEIHEKYRQVDDSPKCKRPEGKVTRRGRGGFIKQVPQPAEVSEEEADLEVEEPAQGNTGNSNCISC